MAKPLNKIILVAAVLSLLLGAWAVQVALSPPPDGPNQPDAGSGMKVPPLPPRPEQAQGDRLRAKNFFVNALIHTPAQAAAGQPTLGPNEVRDAETAEVFRFIGTLRASGGFVALFVKRLETPGPLQIQAVPARAGLSPRILVSTVSERKAALVVDGSPVEVEIFALQPPAAAIHSK